MTRPTTIRLAIFLAVVVSIWTALVYGVSPDDPDLEVGRTAPRTFIADTSAEVVDVVATEEARAAARDSVEPIWDSDQSVEEAVNTIINQVFDRANEFAVAEPPAASDYSAPTLPEPAEQEEEAVSGPFTLTGRVYLDVNGNGTFEPDAEGSRPEIGAGRLLVRAETAGGTVEARTGADGSFSLEVTEPVAVVSVVPEDANLPRGWIVNPDGFAHLVECQEQQCAVPDIGVIPNLRPVAEIEEMLAAEFPALVPQTRTYLAVTATEDVIRTALGIPAHLTQVLEAAVSRVYAEFSTGIRPQDQPAAVSRIRGNPPPVFHMDSGQDVEGGQAAAEIVAAYLQANERIDEARTEEARQQAAEAVEPIRVTYVAGETIVTEGTRLTQLHIDAINQTSSPLSLERASVGVLGVIATMVAAVGLYLSRFRPEIWSRPRMVALLGIVLLLSAISIRVTLRFTEDLATYALPVVAFGFITAVLFDQRIGVLVSLGVGVLAALATNDAGMTVYASLATLVPIPFVNAVSSRGAFRNAVIFSSAAAAVVAPASSRAFHVGANDSWYQVMGEASAWAFGASIIASLVGLAALQFFEAAFDVTTTLRLLDLTDRNHAALQLLQEEAFGTFNHSLMVGTLADAAARAIGANPLLARAMAYYHDLGKVENPTYFIENQFGMQNPHDFLEPKESAEIIRSHVTSGVALARKFKIPSDVAQGIVSHHGDGVMRFFYEKARSQEGDDRVDIGDFRHIGHKPRTAETAILMLADALEAACRAVFQTEEPTPDAIEKVVERIVQEKVEDGQLSESPLTLGQLTKIKRAFLDSLIGHYHQRIAYPNFPGS